MNDQTGKLDLSILDKIKKFADVEREKLKAEGSENESAVLYDLEKLALENEKLKLENESLAEEVENRRQDRALRKAYADNIFVFLGSFSVFCGIMLFAEAFSRGKFSLPENVLSTLVGSTAISVIGLVGWIVKGLFQPPKD